VKKITILLVIIFTFLFSNTSWGEHPQRFRVEEEGRTKS
jgi:hypothetical protein